MIKLNFNKDEAILEEGKDSFAGKLIAGTKGKVKIKTPFSGDKEVKIVDKFTKDKEYSTYPEYKEI